MPRLFADFAVGFYCRNKQAVKSAKSYLDFKGFSCQGLIDQLSSAHGGKFTVAQATFGATQAGIC